MQLALLAISKARLTNLRALQLTERLTVLSTVRS